jgi:hypothetical protein
VLYQQTTFETLYKLNEEIQQKELHQKLDAQKSILKYFVLVAKKPGTLGPKLNLGLSSM